MKPLLMTLVALAAVPLSASEPGTARTTDEAKNIHFSLKLLDTDATGNKVEQTVETLLVSDRETRTHTGWRVPVAVVRTRESDGKELALTSYQYQDVGLAFSIQGRAIPHDRVRVSGRVEISGVDRHEVALDAASHSPQIGTFSHHFEATLADGEPTSLVIVPKPDGGSVQLTLTGSIER